MGIPMGESVLNELIQNIIPMTEHDEQDQLVDWEALHLSLQGVFEPASGLDDSDSSRDNSLKKIWGGFKRKKTTKVECAALFSDVAQVDSLDICNGDDPISTEIANTAFAQTSFSVTLYDRQNDPLIFICSKPEQRDSWVDAFRPCVVHALSKSSREETKELRRKLGWQHLVIRSSLISLVILNDVESLECACQKGSRKQQMELNLLDEYNGYSPLHYATILGHTECMGVLLEAGAKVTLEDREGLSPMYHGKNDCAFSFV